CQTTSCSSSRGEGDITVKETAQTREEASIGLRGLVVEAAGAFGRPATLVQSFPVASCEPAGTLLFPGFFWLQQDFSWLEPHDPQQQQVAAGVTFCASGLSGWPGQRQTKCGIPATRTIIAVRCS